MHGLVRISVEMKPMRTSADSIVVCWPMLRCWGLLSSGDVCVQVHVRTQCGWRRIEANGVGGPDYGGHAAAQVTNAGVVTRRPPGGAWLGRFARVLWLVSSQRHTMSVSGVASPLAECTHAGKRCEEQRCVRETIALVSMRAAQASHLEHVNQASG